MRIGAGRGRVGLAAALVLGVTVVVLPRWDGGTGSSAAGDGEASANTTDRTMAAPTDEAIAAPGGATARGGTVLTARTYIHAPYDSVWARFTTVEGFRDWFSAPGLSFGLAPGDSLVWGEPGTPVYGGVLERLQKGRGLAFTFAFTFLDTPEESRVEVDIVERGEVVWVHLRHDCREAPATAEVISPVGWTKNLSRLKTLLETGRPMPWPEEGADPP